MPPLSGFQNRLLTAYAVGYDCVAPVVALFRPVQPTEVAQASSLHVCMEVGRLEACATNVCPPGLLVCAR